MSLNWLDEKYIKLSCSGHRNFSRKGTNLFNFSCNLCGDSATDRRRARGYMYKSKRGNWQFVCHKCGENYSFSEYLEKTNNSMHSDYMLERFQEKISETKTVVEEEIPSIEEFFDIRVHRNIKDYCQRIDQLKDDHKAKKYLLDRKIPLNKLSEMYYTEDLNNLKNVFKNYEDRKFYREPRIIIPVQDMRGDLQGVITRSLNPEAKLRYVNMIHRDGVLIYGMDKVDLSKPKYVLEGPLDSMFLPNAVGVAGADLFKCVELMDDNTTYIFDNQPRNPHIVKRMLRMVEMNKKIVVWPKDLPEKDVNDMVLRDRDVMTIINKHTYKDLEALIQIEDWKKVK